MDNVAPDLLLKYPELPPNLFWGEFRNKGTNTCLDTMGRPAPTKMGLSGCHGAGNNQVGRIPKSQARLKIFEIFFSPSSIVEFVLLLFFPQFDSDLSSVDLHDEVVIVFCSILLLFYNFLYSLPLTDFSFSGFYFAS